MFRANEGITCLGCAAIVLFALLLPTMMQFKLFWVLLPFAIVAGMIWVIYDAR